MPIDPAKDLAVWFAPGNPWVELGVYTPPGGGAAVEGVPLVRDADRSFVDLGRSGAALERIVFLVPVSALAAPAEEGVLEVAGKTIVLSAPPRPEDRAGLVWRLEGRASS
ncbi:head-tail joining protein [Brevundimonas sp.]|uniref:head-tail joining protein n=1 Tax=Brevundimonas sp. TaxID=1871086 RepID=UPI002D71FE81|nr:hypothetical protein [Brevundimonas sp.]HYD29196.1 hypothetical protein [Brevundimonas sp.]